MFWRCWSWFAFAFSEKLTLAIPGITYVIIKSILYMFLEKHTDK